ncbi:MAG: PIN domain-containing protein, partial [Bacteroides xylanisolvens]
RGRVNAIRTFKGLVADLRKITDIEKKYSFDNHDKLIYSTAIKYNVPLLTSDLRLKRYNKKKKMIPQIID